MEGTSFSDIFERAMFYFMDYDFLRISASDRDHILTKHMLSALSDFQSVCVVTLPRNDRCGRFESVLDDEIIEILALGIAYYWLSAKVLNSENVRNNISTKDYSYYSNANLVRETRELRNDLYTNFRQKIVEYSYMHSDIATLEV